MSEHYLIIGPARGEPRSEGEVGVRIRVPLSGAPSHRWTRDFSARLTRELVGHPAIGHLSVEVATLVQGADIVLDGLEDPAAPALADALDTAVEAANRASSAAPTPTPNVTPQDAEEVAHHVQPAPGSPAALPRAGHGWPCPSCGALVATTTPSKDAGEQLTVSSRPCPSCGCVLERNIDGHADRGWRPAAAAIS